MSKTLTNVTVKNPERFDTGKLASLQEARIKGFLNSPLSKTQVISSTFPGFLQEYDALVAQGYERDTTMTIFVAPYIAYLKPPAHLLEEEIQRLKAEVEAAYKADLARQVEEARSALIAQRLAFHEEQERKKEEAKRQKLMAELEQEAADLFKHSI